MIVDAHQHFWHYDPARLDWITPGMEGLMRDWLPADLENALVGNAVTCTVAVQAVGREDETEFLIEQARENSWIAGVVGWTDLTAPDVPARIACWRDTGPLVGIRHQIEDEPTCLNRSDFDRGVAMTQRCGLVYEVLVNDRQLADAVEFCRRHDRHWLIVDHLAKPSIGSDDTRFNAWRNAMSELAGMPHVATKISGLATETPAGNHNRLAGTRKYLDTALALFGEDRLIFGSDWPVCTLATTYDDWFAHVDAWARRQGRDFHSKLFGANATAIYQLANN